MNAITNRRGLLFGALTGGRCGDRGGRPAMAAAQTPDPVFALLEAHKAAWARGFSISRTRPTTTRRLRRPGEPSTTCAGARAVIEHLVEWDEDGAMETRHYLATLLRSPILAPREART